MEQIIDSGERERDRACVGYTPLAILFLIKRRYANEVITIQTESRKEMDLCRYGRRKGGEKSKLLFRL